MLIHIYYYICLLLIDGAKRLTFTVRSFDKAHYLLYHIL